MPAILCIVGQKAVGKTTLIERLIPALKARGYRLATVKRPPHGFDFDVPGKDSYRHFHAGADTAIVYGHGVAAAVRRVADPLPIEQIVSQFAADADLVLVEGHKSSSLAKIEVFRSGVHPRPLYAGQPDYLALASDTPLDLPIPCLDLNDPPAIAAFIAARFPLSSTSVE